MKRKSKKKTKRRYPKINFNLLLASLVLLSALFAWASLEISRDGTILRLDAAVYDFFALQRNTMLTIIFFFFTLLGQVPIVFIITFFAALYLWIEGKHWYVVPLLVSVIGCGFITLLAKELFARVRPELGLVQELTFAFPSGHAGIAVALFGFLGYVVLREMNDREKEIIIFFLAALLILLIGLSRLYLGVHYLSDIVSGYFVGLFWLVIAVLLSEGIRQSKTYVQK